MMKFLLLKCIFLISVTLIAANSADENENNKAELNKIASPKKKTQGRWNNVNFDNIEKEWEKGDDKELLEHEFEHTRRIAEKMGGRSSSPKLKTTFDADGTERVSPESMKELLKAKPGDPLGLGSSSSGIMMFIELKSFNRKKTISWTKKDVDKLCGRWQSLLASGSVDGKMYNTQQDELKPKIPQLLLNIDKQWMAPDALKFIIKQPEVAKVTYNSKTYTPDDLKAKGYKEENDDDDDDDEL